MPSARSVRLVIEQAICTLDGTGVQCRCRGGPAKMRTVRLSVVRTVGDMVKDDVGCLAHGLTIPPWRCAWGEPARECRSDLETGCSHALAATVIAWTTTSRPPGVYLLRRRRPRMPQARVVVAGGDVYHDHCRRCVSWHCAAAGYHGCHAERSSRYVRSCQSACGRADAICVSGQWSGFPGYTPAPQWRLNAPCACRRRCRRDAVCCWLR